MKTRDWRRYFIYRSEGWRTTWLSRALLLALLLGAMVAHPLWTPLIANSLVCGTQPHAASDVIVIENFDPDYLAFEQAARLYRDGLAPRVVVAVPNARGTDRVNAITRGNAELMARVSRLPVMELFAFDEREPITLNAGVQLRDFLKAGRVKSVTIVAGAFRSKRSHLTYSSVLEPAGIAVRCVPVFGARDSVNWTDTWHGIQDVSLQTAKLLYYRLWVLT